MPAIQFDVLIPLDTAPELHGAFDRAVERLLDAGKLTAGTVTCEPNPTLGEGIEEQLRTIYRDEHEDAELENARVHRYLIAVEGVQGSVNALTMAFSRLLTPPADLPSDPVLLENEQAHEVPATYPWTVEIRR